MSSDGRKLLREWTRIARRLGWTVEVTGAHGGHLKWTTPDGQPVYTPSTPGRNRSIQNTRAELRRAGLPL